MFLFEEVKGPGHEELEAGTMEGVITLNSNHYVGLVEETEEGLELIRKYHSSPYNDKSEALKAAKNLTYVYR